MCVKDLGTNFPQNFDKFSLMIHQNEQFHIWQNNFLSLTTIQFSYENFTDFLIYMRKYHSL